MHSIVVSDLACRSGRLCLAARGQREASRGGKTADGKHDFEAPPHCRVPAEGVKCLTVVDDFTKEAVDIVVDHGVSGLYVARAMKRAARFSDCSKAVRTDQGSEFTSRALDLWTYANGVTPKLIQAGKPTQNAYIESFNGKFRDACLYEHWFTTLAHARAVIAAWRQDYNEQRPQDNLPSDRARRLFADYKPEFTSKGREQVYADQRRAEPVNVLS